MAVIELTDGYKIEYDAKGITGQRQFIEGDFTSAGGVTVPVIGDLFHNPLNAAQDNQFEHMYCTKVSQSYVQGDKRKVLYTCSYTNEPIDPSNMILDYTAPSFDPNDLPININYSGEIRTWSVPFVNGVQDTSLSKWEVEGTGVKIIDAITYRTRTYSATIQRIIPENKYTEFVATINDNTGKVNANDMDAPLKGKAECWLFLGARSELFRDQQDKRAYNFELSFSYKDVDGSGIAGWQKIMDRYGKWIIPINTSYTAGQQRMFMTTDFKPLFQLED